MRVQRPPTLLLVLTLLFLANANSKPLVGYIPEHCQSHTGSLLKACIETAKFDTIGLYTNRVVSPPNNADLSPISVDRDSAVGHTEFYDSQPSTSFYDIAVSQN
uniref:ORF3 protein n=1 Tax=Middle East respiratory syndrome-related coronavirus TaxID=1335626 RepID=A0A2I6PIW1_MERS|nr:ORF3 protein [Middle East respiratory syndrome-related coronavirus]